MITGAAQMDGAILVYLLPTVRPKLVNTSCYHVIAKVPSHRCFPLNKMGSVDDKELLEIS